MQVLLSNQKHYFALMWLDNCDYIRNKRQDFERGHSYSWLKNWEEQRKYLIWGDLVLKMKS